MPTKKELGIKKIRYNSDLGIENEIGCSVAAITKEWVILDIPDNGQIAMKKDKVINKNDLL